MITRFTRKMLILEETWVRNKISSISYHEHVTDVSVTKSEIFWKILKINLTKLTWIEWESFENPCRWRIQLLVQDYCLELLLLITQLRQKILHSLSNFLKLPHHVSSCSVSIAHNTPKYSFHFSLIYDSSINKTYSWILKVQ